jgi:hypothetical protein
VRDLREEEEEELIVMEGRLTIMQQMKSLLKVGRFRPSICYVFYFTTILSGFCG